MTSPSERPRAVSGTTLRGAPPARIGDYELGDKLGQGGMAQVFAAERVGPHGFRKRVALKRILPHLVDDPAFVEMFVAEAQLCARLEHPNIVQVFDFGVDGRELFLAMELVEGTSVARLLRVLASRGEAVPLEVALHVTLGAARALAYAHRLRGPEGAPLALVHRDVSPGNLLLTASGHVKLVDFGIARTELRERHTDEQNLRGKIGYMSPEQVTGQPLDGQSDVFTLAIVLAEMLLGETLFAQGSDLDILLRIRDLDLGVLMRTPRRIPSDVRKLLLLALGPTPAARPDARAMALSLEEILANRGLARGAGDAVARLLFRHELVNACADDCVTAEPGARPTALLGVDDDPTDRVLQVETAPVDAPAVPVRESGYVAKLPDGPLLGPVPFPELLRLTTTGVIDARVPVARNGEPARPACELAELSRIFSTPALQWDAAEIRRPRMKGELSAAILLPLIHSLYRGRETGMLYLSDGDRRKKVYFVDGRPDFVASSDRQEMLGDYLVETGRCLPMELDMALAVLPQHGGRLGDALVNLGVLRPVELYRAVSSQVRARYLDAFGWRTGQWLYVREAKSQEETYPIEQDAQLLMRDAAVALHPSELEAALAPVWERVVKPSLNPPAQVSDYQLPDAWSWVIGQAQGTDTVGSVFARATMQSRLDGEDAMRALVLAISCQLLEAA